MKIFNTLSQKLEPFEPSQPPNVAMYVCGPTVYDHSHIGHGRTYIAYDVIVRYLKYKGFNVTYVRNITDIDDKIIRRASEEHCTISEVSMKYADSFHQDLHRLGLQEPDFEPKATETVSEMIRLIQELIQKGHAYEAVGDVYFAVGSFLDYGKLSKKNIEDLIAGARVAPDEKKRDALDFALWKKSKEGEPSWESPWGKGRPGWHIECSAMAKKLLGDTLDIHSGGRDLIFPHHENEIAQSECANQKPFAKYWLHNGFVNISKEKMSKSLGNMITLKELFQKAHPEALKFYMLSSHYRSPIDFSFEDLQSASQGYDRLMRTLYSVIPATEEAGNDLSNKYIAAFEEAMNEDFNTPKAVSVLFDLVRETNRAALKQETYASARQLSAVLQKLGRVLGLFSMDPKEYFRSIPDANALDVEKIEQLIAKRVEYRREKNFPAADQVRIELQNLGVILEDSPEGTTWRKK